MNNINFEIQKLNKFGNEVFGDNTNFEKWLNSKSITLGNVEPKSFLKTFEGIQLVKDELGRIEHGIIS
ncbi:MbcA/ParS/Xre antitoxin family protein [Maribacter sp. 1_MG-2023]|uniref:MbcA/ParS/Xre antitoxin family protein n=1 Tax=Maribacter sp. 1_MG-2023 TaxID=3062677 RepID=UPI0026E40629|nr:MbcA/ParS/Xre antitoxin family protein [Maribacter sp. 1_MG-2023]MDO6472154.1 MbcA/ParS/Xre antitoxin family protein [Maribacter sp. 1_MG-2023]